MNNDKAVPANPPQGDVAAPASTPSPGDVPPHSAPQTVEVLRWIAAAAPQLWFPSRQAAELGLVRESLDEPVWSLRQAGLIRVGDWVKDHGQGYVLTPEGELAARPNQTESGPTPGVKPKAELSVDGAGPTHPRSVIAPAFLIANVVWFVVGCVIASTAGVGLFQCVRGELPATADMLMRIGALTGESLLRGEWWRLLTAFFVHIGLAHLLGNMLMLGIMGPVAEGLWGRWRFGVVYIVSGLASTATAVAFKPVSLTDSVRDVLHAGASGAIWGIMSGLLLWLLLHRRELEPKDTSDWVRRLLLVVFMSFLLGMTPGNSMEGHLGGGIAGAILVIGFDGIASHRRRNRWWGFAGLLLVATTIPALLYGTERWSTSWEKLRQRQELRKRLETRRHAEAEQRAVATLEMIYRAAASIDLDAYATFELRVIMDIQITRSSLETLRGLIQTGEGIIWDDEQEGQRGRRYLEAASKYADVVASRLAQSHRPDDMTALAAAWKDVVESWIELGMVLPR